MIAKGNSELGNAIELTSYYRHFRLFYCSASKQCGMPILTIAVSVYSESAYDLFIQPAITGSADKGPPYRRLYSSNQVSNCNCTCTV